MQWMNCSGMQNVLCSCTISICTLALTKMVFWIVGVADFGDEANYIINIMHLFFSYLLFHSYIHWSVWGSSLWSSV